MTFDTTEVGVLVRYASGYSALKVNDYNCHWCVGEMSSWRIVGLAEPNCQLVKCHIVKCQLANSKLANCMVICVQKENVKIVKR
jgi:hypothetical protein